MTTWMTDEQIQNLKAATDTFGIALQEWASKTNDAFEKAAKRLARPFKTALKRSNPGLAKYQRRMARNMGRRR